jgi:hypothetical protein
MQDFKNLIIFVFGIATTCFLVFIFFLINSLRNDVSSIVDKLNENELKIAVLENNFNQNIKLDQIEQEVYKQIIQISNENLEKRLNKIENDLLKHQFHTNGSIERRLIICLATTMEIQKKIFQGEDFQRMANDLLNLTIFDPVLNAMVLNIKKIHSVKTQSQLVEDYIFIVRRISQEYYKSKGRYITAFISKYFYVTKTNARFYKIGLLIEQKNFEQALVELKFATQNIESEDAREYISSLENYIAVNRSLDDIKTYVISKFSSF